MYQDELARAEAELPGLPCTWSTPLCGPAFSFLGEVLGGRSSSHPRPVFLVALCDNYCILFLATFLHLVTFWDSVLLTHRVRQQSKNRKGLRRWWGARGSAALPGFDSTVPPTLPCAAGVLIPFGWRLRKGEAWKEKKIHIFPPLLWKHAWLRPSRWPRNSICRRHQRFQRNQS